MGSLGTERQPRFAANLVEERQAEIVVVGDIRVPECCVDACIANAAFYKDGGLAERLQ